MVQVIQEVTQWLNRYYRYTRGGQGKDLPARKPPLHMVRNMGYFLFFKETVLFDDV